MTIKGIVMDMDGTITQFNLDYMAARRKALEEVEKLNLRTPEMTEQLSLYLILKKLKDELDADTFASLRRRFYNLLEEMEVNAANEVTLYPGAVETLRKLRACGLRIGLVTNNGRVGTGITLRRCELAGFFDAVVTRDDCEEMKPDPGPVRKLLAEMGVPLEEAILVGDGVIDIHSRAGGRVTIRRRCYRPIPERTINSSRTRLPVGVSKRPATTHRTVGCQRATLSC